jgi:hypothetical protein
VVEPYSLVRLQVNTLQPGANALSDGGHFGTGKVNLAVHGHEKVDGFQLRICGGQGPAFMDKLIGQVFDGMTENLQSVASLRTDSAATQGPGGGESR